HRAAYGIVPVDLDAAIDRAEQQTRGARYGDGGACPRPRGIRGHAQRHDEEGLRGVLVSKLRGERGRGPAEHLARPRCTGGRSQSIDGERDEGEGYELAARIDTARSESNDPSYGCEQQRKPGDQIRLRSGRPPGTEHERGHPNSDELQKRDEGGSRTRDGPP